MAQLAQYLEERGGTGELLEGWSAKTEAQRVRGRGRKMGGKSLTGQFPTPNEFNCIFRIKAMRT